MLGYMYLHEILAKLLAIYGVLCQCSYHLQDTQAHGQVIHHLVVQCSDELRAKFVAKISVYDLAGSARVA